MFSDKFTEINNYSLFRKEYIDTTSIMPWRYTSIFDDELKPDLSQEIKDKLQLFFYYRLQYTPKLLEDDKKYIQIVHNNNQIKEFRAANSIALLYLKDPSEWKHFIHTIKSPNLDLCKQKIYNFVKDHQITAAISSITFDENCDATGMYFTHSCPNPINDSELITKLHTTTKLLPGRVDVSNRSEIYCGVSVHITPNTNCLRYKISPTYHLRTLEFAAPSDLPGSPPIMKQILSTIRYKAVQYQKHTENCINVLLEQNSITSEMADYIMKVMPEDTKMELEYIINSSGELEDIILHNKVIEEFGNVADEQKESIFDTFNTREERNIFK